MTLLDRISQKRWALLVAFAVLLVAAGVGSFAAFSATTQNANNLSANPDWTAPSVSSQVLAATSSGIANHVKPGGSYYVYANVSDSGNPAAGVASVTADASGFSAGQGSATLTSGSFTFGGTNYNRRTGTLTADATIPACRYAYPITATDSASPSNSATQTVQTSGRAMVDRDLSSDYNIRLDGEMSGGKAGYDVANAGDVNGDSRPDALIGSIEVGRDTRTTAGSVYVVFGQASPTDIDLNSLGSQGYRIDGMAAGALTGSSVANAGDVNADGTPDALIGAHGRADAYVIFGKTSTTSIDLNAIGTNGYRIDGVGSTNFGLSVENAGDVNGDGKQDAIIGAELADNNGRSNSGSAYVIFGKSTTTAVDVAALGTAGYRIDGAAASQNTGRGVGAAGDVNADGNADVILGAHTADYNGRTNSGSAYIVFGKSADQNPIDLAALGTGGYRIDGAAANSSTGYKVAGAGDVNGDGTPDTLIGAYQADFNSRTDSGSTYVVFGKSSDTNTIDLAALGTGGYRIDGAVAGDALGVHVDNAGDVNGDSIPDAVIGAYLADFNGRSSSGAAYVVFGKASDTNNIDLNGIGSAGYRIDGAAAVDQAGWGVAGAGDVDGDGKADVLVGELYADHTDRVSAGAAHVIYGKATTSNIDLSSVGSAGYRIAGEGAAALASWGISSAGDVNGDGLEDVVIGAHGRDSDNNLDLGAAYVVFGQASPANVNLGALGTDGYRIDGAAANDNAGYRVANAGDLNGDGKDDTLVSAYQTDNNGRSASGSVYVVFGKTDTSTVSLAALGTGGYRIDGATASENVGISLANAGDVNSDGKDDQLIGAYLADANGRANSGTAFVVFGKATTTNIDLASIGTNGYRINGAVANDNAGRMVANAGDVNGDGTPDQLVGAPLADNNARTDSGSAYVVWGKADNAAIDLAALGTGGYRIDGVGATYNTGWSLAGAGDLNGDARPDVIVGANTADHNSRSNSGSAYVVFGKTDNATIDLASLGTAGYRIDGATASDNAAYSLANAGDVNGDGTPDALVGAYAFNKPGGISDSGAAYVVFGKSTTTNIDLASPGLNAYRLDGNAALDQTGITLASAGDYNGDGRSDFLIGARYADWAGPDGGVAYIRYSPPCSYSSTVLATPGVHGYWRLGESSGAAATDSKGTNNGTYDGGVTQGVEDALRTDDDRAASLDGADDRVTVSSFSGFPSTAISAEFWMRSSDAAKLGTPLSYASSASSNDFLIHNYKNLAVHVAGVQLSTGVAANDGAWHHIAVTWRGSDGQVRLYKDGSLAFSGSLANGASITGGGTLMLGQEQDSVGGGIDPAQAFLGSLDEVAVYDRVLKPVEVQDHYEAR